jgi:hypothetical protein
MVAKAHASNVHEPLDISRCWAHAKGEISACIAEDKVFKADGLSGDLNNLVRMERWTATAACLDIKDMRKIDTVEADDLELEDAGPNSDFYSDSADGAERKFMCFNIIFG